MMAETRAKMRACETCLYLMDDHKCHRYPPSIPRYSVSYNLVTKYPLASMKSGGTLAEVGPRGEVK